MTTSTIARSAWEQTKRHHRGLHALTDTISQDPTALPAAVRRARSETFGSLDALLLDAHAQWVRTFEARLDQVLEHGGYGDQDAVDQLWLETARTLDGTATLLQAYADHPAVVRAHAQHARRTRHTVGVDLPSTWVRPRPVRRHQSTPASLSGLRTMSTAVTRPSDTTNDVTDSTPAAS